MTRLARNRDSVRIEVSQGTPSALEVHPPMRRRYRSLHA